MATELFIPSRGARARTVGSGPKHLSRRCVFYFWSAAHRGSEERGANQMSGESLTANARRGRFRTPQPLCPFLCPFPQMKAKVAH